MLEATHEGWYVAYSCEPDGTIKFSVRHREHGLVDLLIYVKHYPKWMFWFKPFDERVRIVSDIAQQRAWELNQQAVKARQQIYEIEVAARRNNE